MPSVFIAKSLFNSRKAESLEGDAEASGGQECEGTCCIKVEAISNPNKRREMQMARKVNGTHPKQRGWLLCRARHNQRCRKWAERLGRVGKEEEVGLKWRVTCDGKHGECDVFNGECKVKSNVAHLTRHTSNVTLCASSVTSRVTRHKLRAMARQTKRSKQHTAHIKRDKSNAKRHTCNTLAGQTRQIAEGEGGEEK